MALHPTAQRYEYGTQNDALFFALGAALDFVNAIGLERIGVTTTRWRSGSTTGCSRSRAPRSCHRKRSLPDRHDQLRVDGHTHAEVNEHLAKSKIRVRPVTEGGLNCIRVSFHICNHDAEATKILDALGTLA